MSIQHPMSHPQFHAIQTVARAVLASEKQIDDAIQGALDLASITLRTAEEASLPRQLAQPAIERISAAMVSLVTTRREIINAHEEYGKVAHGLGATVESFGDFWPCPKPSARKARIAIVAA